jgi:hypothetical protein
MPERASVTLALNLINTSKVEALDAGKGQTQVRKTPLDPTETTGSWGSGEGFRQAVCGQGAYCLGSNGESLFGHLVAHPARHVHLGTKPPNIAASDILVQRMEKFPVSSGHS